MTIGHRLFFVRTSYVSTLCPVVIRPYLCTSEILLILRSIPSALFEKWNWAIVRLVFVCIHIYIYIYICMYTYIHTYLPTYLPTYIHTYIHTDSARIGAPRGSAPRADCHRPGRRACVCLMCLFRCYVCFGGKHTNRRHESGQTQIGQFRCACLMCLCNMFDADLYYVNPANLYHAYTLCVGMLWHLFSQLV